jgi:two-component system chemotaxis sensor kinase CheA
VVFDEHGIPEPVLAAPGLVFAATAMQPPEELPLAPRVRPLLVIDDSLTTRMLEQSILESAGYEVDLAVSAEDALQKAKQREYGVFVVDVEMPGMNGFEFIATARNDPKLSSVPSILVTSKSDAEDKRRGEEVGARAYIVKSEFNQSELLDSIRRLLA